MSFWKLEDGKSLDSALGPDSVASIGLYFWADGANPYNIPTVIDHNDATALFSSKPELWNCLFFFWIAMLVEGFAILYDLAHCHHDRLTFSSLVNRTASPRRECQPLVPKIQGLQIPHFGLFLGIIGSLVSCHSPAEIGK